MIGMYRWRPRNRRAWILAAVAVAVLVVGGLAILMWPDEDSGGPAPAETSRRELAPSSFTSLLDREPRAGELIFLNDVHLAPGARKNQYFARGAGGNYLLVVASTEPVSVHHSTRADVRGFIRHLPSKRILKRAWKLNNDQLKLISGQSIYIAADQIDLAGQ